MIRNSTNEWITGFLIQTESGGILAAELKGIYLGLLVVKEMNLKKIRVESDCAKALSWVRFECPSQHPCLVVGKNYSTLI